jgi:hypothetical protein
VAEKGIAADPDHSGLQARYAFSLASAGYTRAAVEPALRAVALGPNERGYMALAVHRLHDAGRINDAMARLADLQRLWGNEPDVRALAARMLYLRPDPKGALAVFRRSPPTDPDLTAMLLPQLEWRADPAAFDWSRFDRMSEREFAAEPLNAWQFAVQASRMHDSRRALAWLARAPTTTDGSPWIDVFSADAAELRRDPRFFAKMNQLGLVELWRKRGQWPDFCSEPGLGYSCKTEAARMAKAGR